MHSKYILLGLLFVLLLLSGVALGQNGYQITQWAVTGIDGQPSSDNYMLSGTLGRSDAEEMAGGDYTLQGGIVAGGDATEGPTGATIYLPAIQR